jgi:hypothetical protein
MTLPHQLWGGGGKGGNITRPLRIPYGWINDITYILVWPVLLAQVLPSRQLSFLSKTWFFGIYLNFQQQKSFSITIFHILNPNLTK